MSNDSVTNKKYKLDNITHTLENTIDKEEYVTKVKLDDKEMNYSYDELGRITGRDIGAYQTKYHYLSNGNRTTSLIKKVMNNNDEYEYKYDKLYNITDIYHNQQLIKHYEYDIYNQLKKEENYDTNKTIEYTYDNSGI